MAHPNTIIRMIETAKTKARKAFQNLPEHKTITAICSLLSEDDIGNAARLVLRHGHKFRFVESEKGGAYLVFDGKRWTGGDHGQADLQDFAQNTAQHIRQELEFLKPKKGASEEDTARARQAIARRLKHAEKSGNHTQIRNMIAQSKGAVKEKLEAFDDPDTTSHLFNVANGTIDLETGKMKPHDPADRITHLVDLVFDPKAKAPSWDSFLWSVFEENSEKCQFFQRLIGYTMHGHQEEENVVFILGNEKAEKTNGSNGKSRLLEAIRPVFGEYAWSVKTALICKHKNKNDESSDIADLFGKRIGIGSEFKDDDVIEADAFKRATGADKVNARQKWKTAFDFHSTATLFYTANRTPIFETSDNGILRRPIFLQLNRVFYKASEHPCGIPAGGHIADLKLGRKLRAEAQGILAWAVRGAVAYNTDGLNTPRELLEDREQRLQAFDPLQDWLDACVEFDPSYSCRQGDMFESYKRFCEIEATGDPKMNARTFGDKLTSKRITRDKKSGQPWRFGVRLTEAGMGYAKGITPDSVTNKKTRHLQPVK